ncbi:MAG: trypsin-like serine peptidase [Parachlamydiaceae bacterium]
MEPTSSSYRPCPIDRTNREKALYTQIDHRKNLFELNINPEIKRQAESVGCLIEVKHLQTANSEREYITLNQTHSLKDRIAQQRNFDDSFQDEPSLGTGTAFFVGGPNNNLVLTAGHCVCKEKTSIEDPEFKEKMRLVFGFTMQSKGNCNLNIQKNKVCKIKKVVDFSKNAMGDWALLELEEPLTHIHPLKMDFKNLVSEQQNIYMLGHPCGLPLKLTECGSVQVAGDGENRGFQAKIDAFAGNSGSPIFDKETKKVIGILIEGNEDYDSNSTGVSLHHVEDKEVQKWGYEECQRTTSLPQAIMEMIKQKEVTERKKADKAFNGGTELLIKEKDPDLDQAFPLFKKAGKHGVLAGYFACSIIVGIKEPENTEKAQKYLEMAKGYSWQLKPLAKGEVSAINVTILEKGEEWIRVINNGQVKVDGRSIGQTGKDQIAVDGGVVIAPGGTVDGKRKIFAKEGYVNATNNVLAPTAEENINVHGGEVHLEGGKNAGKRNIGVNTPQSMEEVRSFAASFSTQIF